MLLQLGRAGALATSQEGTVEIVVHDAARMEELHRLDVHCRLEELGARFRVQGELRGVAASHCHRCLGAFERSVQASFSFLLQRGGNAEADEVVVVPEGAETFDLAPIVKEAVILEEPMVLLCRDDCKGLCPRCGKDLNEGHCACEPSGNPQWETLRKLLESREP